MGKAGDATGAERRLRRLPYDVAAVELVAATLGASVRLADFRLPGAAVYQVTVAGTNNRPATMLTLWPSIRRVDAIGAAATVVFTDVETVDLVAEIEVQFRRVRREYLIIARGGKIIVRA